MIFKREFQPITQFRCLFLYPDLYVCPSHHYQHCNSLTMAHHANQNYLGNYSMMQFFEYVLRNSVSDGILVLSMDA